jgi:opacity protein-like surface antigen
MRSTATQLLLILAVLIVNPLFGQHFKAGFTLGVAATQVDGDGHSGYNKAGPILGIWVSRNLGGNLFARFELRYIQKGSYAKNTDDGAYYRIRLHYIEMPLLIGYRFVNGFSAKAGLSGGYLAEAKEMNELGGFPPEDISAFRKYEVAGLAGIEYNYSERWALGVLYSYSILPIRPFEGNITYRLQRGQYNNVLEFYARLKL